MQRGLEGRRIAVFAGADGDRLKQALENAGALVVLLSDGRERTDAEWHAGRYAAVVLGSGRDDDLTPKIVQLVREFLLSGKPVVSTGDGLELLRHAGGSAEDALVANSRADIATESVRMLTDALEDSQVDEMSDMSFPASDPPATTPASIGAKHTNDSEAR